MIVDASAIIAIILHEPEREALISAIVRSPRATMSGPSYVETALKTDRIYIGADPILDAVITELGVTLVPFTPHQANLAREAVNRFGKGRHKAALNFGDCLTYALAKDTGEPLLCKGKDFPHTDLHLVEY